MSDRLTDEQIATICDYSGSVVSDTIAAQLAREVQARRLSDITTPICPTCNGVPGGYGFLDHCPDCTDGHIPLKVWVGMLTDALRDSWQSEFPAYLNIERVIGLADSVTPKENE